MTHKVTRADVLADLARAYVLEPVGDNEITMAMLIEQGICSNDMAASRVLRMAEKDGKLEAPVKRTNASGRTVLAWPIKGA